MCKTAVALENTRLCTSERLIHLLLAVVPAVVSSQPSELPQSEKYYADDIFDVLS